MDEALLGERGIQARASRSLMDSKRPRIFTVLGVLPRWKATFGCSSRSFSGGEVSVIDRSYEYCHYLQDRMDDKGWGCAYRSLQTIMSWFRLQHYTFMKEPSHRNRRQGAFFCWISRMGSSDRVKLCTRQTSRGDFEDTKREQIYRKNAGSLRHILARKALQKLNTGGGVLAYTLLGVDYNKLTGESAFLILDPYYTGGEDLKSIRSGGWCRP
ncbi:hypothetical protein SELMODRAFT_419450 [Selaginella moellendorffii]|uniref:UFSP1/2/DUB catalytic domain-containing protein n=1 Tax=Selaginella moellendorffii TaxID=88036 RepID=D8S901_SELML|nr:hypothetical protein SELMODRAFT_419450 [Selaginella moellendorffii]